MFDQLWGQEGGTLGEREAGRREEGASPIVICAAQSSLQPGGFRLDLSKNLSSENEGC